MAAAGAMQAVPAPSGAEAMDAVRACARAPVYALRGLAIIPARCTTPPCVRRARRRGA